jgi:hypothetical protein
MIPISIPKLHNLRSVGDVVCRLFIIFSTFASKILSHICLYLCTLNIILPAYLNGSAGRCDFCVLLRLAQHKSLCFLCNSKRVIAQPSVLCELNEVKVSRRITQSFTKYLYKQLCYSLLSIYKS